MNLFVRGILTIGLAGFALPALAEGDSGAVINELMQKGRRGEREDGLCARTAWPVRAPGELLPRYKAWLGGARAGGDPWQWRSATGCTTAVIVSVRTSGGRKCLTTRTFVCTVDALCTSTPADWCPAGNGDFERCACD